MSFHHDNPHVKSWSGHCLQQQPIIQHVILGECRLRLSKGGGGCHDGQKNITYSVIDVTVYPQDGRISSLETRVTYCSLDSDWETIRNLLETEQYGDLAKATLQKVFKKDAPLLRGIVNAVMSAYSAGVSDKLNEIRTVLQIH